MACFFPGWPTPVTVTHLYEENLSVYEVCAASKLF